jgi:protein O-mannosyl-transferase
MRLSDAAALSERKFVLLSAAILVVAALLAYANSFSVPLIFDDWVTILKNPKLRQLWPIWDALTPPEDTGVGGRPVANLSFVLNYALTGESMAGFHAMNLAIHLGAGLLLFGLIRRTLLRLAWGTAQCGWVALAAAAMWLLQPLQTQSVTYVSQRTESLMGLFYFATLYGFARAIETGAPRRWIVLSVLSCVAGMATKEGMATAPVMVFLYDCVFGARSVGEAWRQRWRIHVGLAASWLLLALLTRGLHGRGVGFGHGMSSLSYLLIEFRAIVRYFVLSIWPSPLVFDYGVDLNTGIVSEVVCVFAVVAFAATSAWAMFRWPTLGFLGAWFLITLAPTSSVVPIALQPISENRVYLPSAAVIVAAVVAACWCVGKRGLRLMIAAALVLTWLTALRNRDYRSEIAIWTDTVAKRPTSSRAHSNLGQALQSAGRLAEAKTQHEIALQIRPNYSEAHANLAALLGQLGDIDGAVKHSVQAVTIDPRNANAFYNLGVALSQKGDVAGAIAAYEASVRIRPISAEARGNLALLLLRSNRVADAIVHSEEALRINPNSIDGHFVLACGLMLTGRVPDAVPHFLHALRLQPNHIDAYQNLGVALQQLGKLPEAIASYEAALRLNPNLHDAHVNLGVALVQSGRTNDAVAHFNAALQLNPASPIARQQLEQLRSAGERR